MCSGRRLREEARLTLRVVDPGGDSSPSRLLPGPAPAGDHRHPPLASPPVVPQVPRSGPPHRAETGLGAPAGGACSRGAASTREEPAYLLESDSCVVRCFLTEHPPRISPIGELDLAAAPILDQVLDLLFSRPPEDVVVDLSGASFFGVTGLAFLARLHQRLAAHGHRAIIVEATAHVARTLERIGLDRLFLVGPAGTAPHDVAVAATTGLVTSSR